MFRSVFIFLAFISIGYTYDIDLYFGEATHLDGGFIKKIKKQFNPADLVETGTYLGETSELGARNFTNVYTVEIFKDAYDSASQRLARYKNVHCFNDNSLNFLKQNQNLFSEQSLFWLDAHYSGTGTGSLGVDENKIKSPLRDEVEQIMSHFKDHYVLLIDDIRGYINVPDKMRDGRDYPTVKELYQIVMHHNKNAKFYILGDHALIFDGKTYNLSVSPQVEAFTNSFLFDGYHQITDKDLIKVLQAEKVIARTWLNKKIDKVLDRLYAAYVKDTDFAYYPVLWKALRQMHKKEYENALINFSKLLEPSQPPPHSRIYFYMSICCEKLEQSRQAAEYLSKVDGQTLRCKQEVYRWTSL